jgi:nucleoside 2-deoxyribosyltransferase
MPKPKIYFAASIRSGRDDQPIYEQIIELLKSHGTVLSEHFGSSSLTSNGEDLTNTFIRNRDKEWVREADLIIAEVTIPSLGVGIELGWAEEWDKKVICLYREQEGRRLSALVDGAPGFQVFRYKTTEDVKKILADNLR